MTEKYKDASAKELADIRIATATATAMFHDTLIHIDMAPEGTRVIELLSVPNFQSVYRSFMVLYNTLPETHSSARVELARSIGNDVNTDDNVALFGAKAVLCIPSISLLMFATGFLKLASCYPPFKEDRLDTDLDEYQRYVTEEAITSLVDYKEKGVKLFQIVSRDTLRDTLVDMPIPEGKTLH